MAAPAVDDAARTVGEMLLADGRITAEQLDRAVAISQRSGTRIGQVLLSMGAVDRTDLYATLSRQWSLPFVDLTRIHIDPALTARCEPATLVAAGWVPVRTTPTGLVVATSERPDAALDDAVRATFGAVDIDYAVTTEWDIGHAVAGMFRDRMLDRAANGLADWDPDQSARTGFVRWQKIALAVLLVAGIGAAFTLGWSALLFVVIGAELLFAWGVAFKATAFVAGWYAVRRAEREQKRAVRIPDDELPTYTLLVPAFKEANVVAELLAQLDRLDYPREKIEILLLLEENDHETIEAARAAQPPETVRFVLIPEGDPQTKPKACNIGLFFARGELTVIYDAEDAPDPGQLREAVTAFRDGPDDLVCVQARLNYYNADQNLLTRMFTLEYSYWFDYMLPGLDLLDLPIPLGGTSNHFRTDGLRELQAWDPWNVTEDADLGIRAAALGFRVGIIPSTTYEEASSRLGQWIPQRTRWIKRYMQTAVVHTRRPWRSARNAGWRGSLTLGGLIAGSPLTFLAVPIVWAVFVASLFGVGLALPWPHVTEPLALANFVVGNLALIAFQAASVARRKLWSLIPFALLAPLYWLLHSYAAYRALWQLVFAPSKWEKTPHGFSAVRPTASLPGAEPGQ